MIKGAAARRSAAGIHDHGSRRARHPRCPAYPADPAHLAYAAYPGPARAGLVLPALTLHRSRRIALATEARIVDVDCARGEEERTVRSPTDLDQHR